MRPLGSGTLLVLLLGLIGLALGIAYAGALPFPFIYDDQVYVVSKQVMAATPSVLWEQFPTRIVGFLSFKANYLWGGADPVGYRLVNVFVHGATAVAAFFLAKGLLRSAALALLVALLFAVHPMQTESVTYIWQRVAALAGCFYLGSLAFFGASLRAAPARARGFHVAAVVTAVLAMFTKQFAVTLPVAALLLDWHQRGDWWRFDRARLRRLAPFVLAAALIPLTMHLAGDKELRDLAETDRVMPTHLTYFLAQMTVIPRYLKLFFVPWPQSIAHDVPLPSGVTLPVLLGFVLLVAIALYALRTKNFTVRFGLLFFFVAAAVESSVVPLHDLMFEHRMYLAYFGLLAAGAGLLERVPARRAVIAALAVATVACVSLTRQRNQVWRSPEALWGDVVAVYPDSVIGNYNLGAAKIDLGDPDEAARLLDHARRIDPTYRKSHISAAKARMTMGRASEALAILEALPHDAGDFAWSLQHATALAQLGDLARSEAELKEALAAATKGEPHYQTPALLNRLADVLEARGSIAEALILVEGFLAVQADDAALLARRVRLKRRLGRLTEAQADVTAAEGQTGPLSPLLLEKAWLALAQGDQVTAEATLAVLAARQPPLQATRREIAALACVLKRPECPGLTAAAQERCPACRVDLELAWRGVPL